MLLLRGEVLARWQEFVGTGELLRSLGMTTVFGNPGSTELPFLRLSKPLKK